MSNSGQLNRYFASRILRLQSPYQEGPDVLILQSLLNLLPDNIIPRRLAIDSILGPDTRYAIICFQKHFNLKANGVAAAGTFEALGHLCRQRQRQPVFSSRCLQPGDSGHDVRVLQNRLAAYKKTCLNRPANGRFDLYTARAVKSLQDDFGLNEENGRIGPETYACIFLNAPLGGRALARGHQGLDCYYLQLYLHQLGFLNCAPDGLFLYSTYKALLRFQQDAGIRADGIASAQTYLALGNSLPFPGGDFFYQAQAGDSFTSISRCFRKPIWKLSRANNLNPARANRIKPGKMLKIPIPLSFHLIKSGDSPEEVADYYNLEPKTFCKANRMRLSQGMVPGESLVLPGYQPNLKGYIVYLNQRGHRTELKNLNLEKMESTIIHIFNQQDIGQLRLQGKEIHIYSSSCWRRYSYSLNNGMLAALSGPLPYRAGPPPNGRDLVSALNFVEVKNNIGEGRAGPAQTFKELGFTLNRKNILPYRFSPDGSLLLIFMSQPPGYGKITYLVNWRRREVRKIGENVFDGVFSADGKRILLLSHNWYGAYYPWFSKKIRLFDTKGAFLGDEIESRSAVLNSDCFDSTSSFFALVMHRPNTFYPLPILARDIYVKQPGSQLLFQITSGENARSPVWI